MKQQNSSDIIEVENLTKKFKSFHRREGIGGAIKDLFNRDYYELTAVDKVSFNLKKGEFVGYIGENGAGKSTTIKMLTGVLKPSSGKVKVLGMTPFDDRKEYVRKIGVVFGQKTQLWWDIAVQESFSLLAKIYKVQNAQKTIDELVEIMGVGEYLGTPVRKLSLGNRMRCDLIASLIHSPEVLFLDEPTIGLDAIAKRSIRDFLREININRKTTIILTTHDLQEIEELSSRVIVLDSGKTVFDGTVPEIKSISGLSKEISVRFKDKVEKENTQQKFSPILSANKIEQIEYLEDGFNISFLPEKITSGEIINLSVDISTIADVHIQEPGIEDVVSVIYSQEEK